MPHSRQITTSIVQNRFSQRSTGSGFLSSKTARKSWKMLRTIKLMTTWGQFPRIKGVAKAQLSLRAENSSKAYGKTTRGMDLAHACFLAALCTEVTGRTICPMARAFCTRDHLSLSKAGLKKD